MHNHVTCSVRHKLKSTTGSVSLHTRAPQDDMQERRATPTHHGVVDPHTSLRLQGANPLGARDSAARAVVTLVAIPLDGRLQGRPPRTLE